MAHCHTPEVEAVVGHGVRTIVLAGNPNVGKSAVFNALTGTYVDVSNFPGTTVEVTRGRMGEANVVDTPGIYGVSSFNDEETVARDVVLAADVVVNVVDAVHLERDLFLTLQLTDMGIPMVVALNMSDEAASAGVAVDRDLLEHIVGVPVVETVAVRGTGIDALRVAIENARPGHGDPELLAPLVEMSARVGLRAEALLVLEGDEIVAARHGIEPADTREAIYRARRERVNDLVGHVVSANEDRIGFTGRLSRWMLEPLTGVPLMAGLLFLMYKVLGEFVAGDIVGLTEESLMQGYWEPFVRGVIERFAAPASAMYEFLAGEFGILTMTPTYLIGVILPLVTGFYMLLSILEDSGYLPRIAALTDRLLRGVGLNGRAIIPIILGLGCVTMATLTTRILGSKRERFIATALMAIAVPCSAQIAVIAALMAQVGFGFSLAYVGVLVLMFGVVGALLARITPGTTTDLLIDLPSLRLPRADNVLRKTVTKVYHFMKEVTVFFLAGAAIMSVLQITGGLEWIQRVATPLTVGWLRLPSEAANAFVMGFVRRDFGATGFFTMDLTSIQLLTGMITITLFVPCIASVMVILKERGGRFLVGLLAGSVGLAFLIGGLVARIAGVVA